MGKSTYTKLQYGLHNILVTKYAYSLPKKRFDPKSPEMVKYNIVPALSFRVDKNNIIVKILINATITETSEQVMEIEASFAFKVQDLDAHINTHTSPDGQLMHDFKDNRNEGLLPVLIGVSYSTMRGIVMERSQGTPLQNTFLPMIDPSTFIKIEKPPQ